jgi:hypothetical protein
LAQKRLRQAIPGMTFWSRSIAQACWPHLKRGHLGLTRV